MNFKLGEKVKILGNETLFEIKGFQSKMRIKNGVTEEKREYILENIQNKSIVRVDEEEIFSKESNSIDHLLDKYNDYKSLFLLLKEKDYEEKMNEVIEKLKKIQIKKRA